MEHLDIDRLDACCPYLRLLLLPFATSTRDAPHCTRCQGSRSPEFVTTFLTRRREECSPITQRMASRQGGAVVHLQLHVPPAVPQRAKVRFELHSGSPQHHAGFACCFRSSFSGKSATCWILTRGFMRSGHGPIVQSPIPSLRGAPAFWTNTGLIACQVIATACAPVVADSVSPLRPPK